MTHSKRSAARAAGTVPALWLLFGLAGCIAPPDPYAAYDRVKLSQVGPVAVVVDASVTHNQTLEADRFVLADNRAVAAAVEARARALLAEKGYAAAESGARAVGASLLATDEGAQELELALVEDRAAGPLPPDLSRSPPFELVTTGAPPPERAALERLLQSHRRAVWSDPGPLLPGDARPFASAPVLVINAAGHYISGGAVALNVAKGALNTVMVAVAVLAAFGGDTGGDIPLASFEGDTVSVCAQLFDGVTGERLWWSVAAAAADPEPPSFAAAVERLFERLPPAAYAPPPEAE